MNISELKIGSNNVISQSDREAQAHLDELLIACRKHLNSVNESLIIKAFHACYNAHKNKLRKSGDQFYTHPLAVAHIVVKEIPLDDISVASALLHNVLDESQVYSYKDLKSEFGSIVADIVDGISKIKHIESQHITLDSQMENYRKLLLSLFNDVRIILIKLADRLHNMRTVKFLPDDSRKRAARETLEIYVPFANRFGLRNLKWELEDLSFKFLHRKSYDEIKKSLYGTRTEREEYIKNLTAPIREKLDNDPMLKKLGISYKISGRAKHIYSIYNKMLARQKSIEELYDLFAIRVILDTDDDYMCFYVYGIIAGIYPPVPETFKDYISSPKKNGYQSIHTAVVGIDKKIVEVQLRTQTMHSVAEKGVAAHFMYKRGELASQSIFEDQYVSEWMSVVRDIFENVGKDTSGRLLENVRKNLFSDEIYVFTPANEFRTMPKDSTPLDFAFEIHSEIGFHCIGAKVNGRIVPLDYKLQSGDQVEILTSKNQKPQHDWLQFIVTSKAISAINKFFRDERKSFEYNGKKIWEEIKQKIDFKFNSREFSQLLEAMKFDNEEDFYFALGNQTVETEKINDYIRLKLNKMLENEPNGPRRTQGIETEFLKNIDLSDYERIRIANCCRPNLDDEILAEKTDSELIIHTKLCRDIEAILRTRPSEVIQLSWENIKDKKIHARLIITGNDRTGMLNDISRAILDYEGTSIHGVSFDTIDFEFEGKIDISTPSIDYLQNLKQRLKAIEGINQVD